MKRIKADRTRRTEYYTLVGAAQTLIDFTKRSNDTYFVTLASDTSISDNEKYAGDSSDNDSEAADNFEPEDEDTKPPAKIITPKAPKKEKMSGSTGGQSRASTGTRNSMGSPSGKPRQLRQFETLQDAIDWVGTKNVLEVDWTRPESHNAPLFLLTLNTNRLNQNKTAQFDKIRIVISSIFDLRDLQRIGGKIIVGGAAFLVSLPSVPTFLLEDHKKMHDSTKSNYCERTKLDHGQAANDILKEEERRVTYYLFVFPEDTLCNANLEKWLPPNNDQRIRISLKPDFAFDTIVKIGNSETTEHQHFNPGYFDLRVCDEEEKVVDADNIPAPKESVSKLADYFEGWCIVDEGDMET